MGFRPLLALPAITLALVAASGAGSATRAADGRAGEPRVVLVTEGAGCSDAFSRALCNAFSRAVTRTGVTGRVVSPTAREDIVDTLDLIARQPHDLVIGTGQAYLHALGVVARRHPKVRFAIMDRSLTEMTKPPPNVQGTWFRSNEAAYLAGWLAGRLEQRRPGRDVVGVVGGVAFPPVDDFVVGFRAGARRAVPGITVLVDYSDDFVDVSKCAALARNQVAKGAGVLFNVAGGCGLGTLDVAKRARVWGVGVDTDQSFLGPHVLTSVLKRLDVAFLTMLRQVRSGTIPTGGETVLTLGGGGVGLGRISPAVPASLRAELDRVRRRIVSGEIRVPGTARSPG